VTTIPTGPIDAAPWGVDIGDWPTALHAPLAGIELGAYDERILAWIAGWDTPTVVTIASLLHRARAAQPIGQDDTVTIPRTEHARLTEADQELSALYAAGVDNWEGYDEAVRS
jgi:hypothetical protein